VNDAGDDIERGGRASHEVEPIAVELFANGEIHPGTPGHGVDITVGEHLTDRPHVAGE
jgi:hypothetical protein